MDPTPTLALTELAQGEGACLVLGPSLGTDVHRLWAPVLPHLPDGLRVVGWDLPGHGTSPTASGWTLEDVARALLREPALAGAFAYAGVSVGGAVGLHLCLAAPERVSSAVLLATGARILTPDVWEERARLVETQGTGVMVEGSAGRWYAPGFGGGRDLLAALPSVDDAGYAATCRALAAHDVRDRLADIDTPVVAVAGRDDVATPVASLAEVADGVRRGRLVVVPDAAHLPTVEQPTAVAAVLADLTA